MNTEQPALTRRPRARRLVRQEAINLSQGIRRHRSREREA